MLYPELTYKIRGIAFDIFNSIAGSWPEEKYEEIFWDALNGLFIKSERQKEFEIFYKENRVGLYRTDLIIEDKIIVELKVVSEVLPLHQAQLISYLKVTAFPMGMLINFGGSNCFIKAFPNTISTRKVLTIHHDINKSKLSEKIKNEIKVYLAISIEILEILGPGFFHQVYRRAFYDELKRNDIEFEMIKKISLIYKGKIYDSKEVRFFRVSELLISIVALKTLDELTLSQFSRYVKNYRCKNGLIINFNAVSLDFRYI